MIEYVLRVGEISLKGANRDLFERRLKKNLKRPFDKPPILRHRNGRLIAGIEEKQQETAEVIFSRTFGLVGFSRTERVAKKIESLRSAAIEIARRAGAEDRKLAFKIRAKRSDKSFPMRSHDIEVDLGDTLREQYPQLYVNLKAPDLMITVEIRNEAFVYGHNNPGPGGLPVGCAGRGTLLLSGGIDSPVAGYLACKRGMKLDAIYFETYPYTSRDARRKVEQLSQSIAEYNVGMTLFVVDFTDIALHIRDKSRPEYTTLMMRACMVEIATNIAERRKCLGLITGDSLSQVASQTLENMRFVDAHAGIPIYRPLFGFDKLETISIPKQIGTYETSILPFEDCCTVFTPASPSIRPKLETVERQFDALEFDGELEAASLGASMTWFEPGRNFTT